MFTILRCFKETIWVTISTYNIFFCKYRIFNIKWNCASDCFLAKSIVSFHWIDCLYFNREFWIMIVISSNVPLWNRKMNFNVERNFFVFFLYFFFFFFFLSFSCFFLIIRLSFFNLFIFIFYYFCSFVLFIDDEIDGKNYVSKSNWWLVMFCQTLLSNIKGKEKYVSLASKSFCNV